MVPDSFTDKNLKCTRMLERQYVHVKKNAPLIVTVSSFKGFTTT